MRIEQKSMRQIKATITDTLTGVSRGSRHACFMDCYKQFAEKNTSFFGENAFKGHLVYLKCFCF